MYTGNWIDLLLKGQLPKGTGGINSPVALSKTKDYSFLSNFCSGFSKENMPAFCKQQDNLSQPEITGYAERSCLDCLISSPPGTPITGCLLSSPCLIPVGIIAALAVGLILFTRRK